MKPLSFILFLLCLNYSVYAETQDSLTLSQWDFDAIKASHQLYSNNNKATQTNNTCTPSLETISKFSQQFTDAIFSSDGCHVYTASQNGWITKYELTSNKILAKIRVGLKTANATLSKDNKILLVGNRQPADLVLLNTNDLSVARMIPVKNRKGIFSPVARVQTSGDNHGFIVVPQDFSKIWKISYLNPAPIGFGDGWNHDYRCLKEHVNKPLFPVKRLKIKQQLTDLQIDNEGIFLVGTNQAGKGMIMDLDLSRVIAHPSIHKLEPGLIWKSANSNRFATLNQGKNKISIYSNQNNPRHWKPIKEISVKSAITMTSCPSSPVLWVSNQNAEIHLIDKKQLKINQTISLKDQGQVTKISCLPSQNTVLLKTANKTLIFDSQTFKQKL